MKLFILGLLIGFALGLCVYLIVDTFDFRLSYFKRFMPWVKPAKVIPVDFKNKTRIKKS
jgi:hypothetical protein